MDSIPWGPSAAHVPKYNIPIIMMVHRVTYSLTWTLHVGGLSVTHVSSYNVTITMMFVEGPIA